MDKQDFLRKISVHGHDYYIADISKLEEKGLANIRRLPFSIRILVENLLRKLDGRIVRELDLLNIANWQKHLPNRLKFPIIRRGC